MTGVREMKRMVWLMTAILLLAACIGCGETSAAPEAAPTAEPDATPMQVSVSVGVTTPTDEPTEEPTPSPTPEPQGEPGVPYADGVGIVYTYLARGAAVEVTGEQDAYYILTIDGVRVLVEKRLIRLESAAEYEAWEGYAKSGTPVYASYHLAGEEIASLKGNARVTVREDLGGCYLIEWEETLGYASADRISKKKHGGGGGGGGSGADGGDIQLSWKRQGSGIVRLGVRLESETAFAPQKGIVLADQTEAYLGFVNRDGEVLVIDEDETHYHVSVDGVTGLVPKPLIRLASDEPYAPWDGYAENKAPFYDNYRMGGEAEALKRNTEVRVLADLGSCYLVEVDGKLGYMPQDQVSLEKVKAPAGGGGGGGDEWTAPVL